MMHMLQRPTTWPYLVATMAVLAGMILSVGLTQLPVFADEAIYIRWAQLIIDEPTRYLFFPLNDGKTPLFIWLLVPFQFITDDPLRAGRTVSVLVGVAQVVVLMQIAKSITKSQLTGISAGIMAMIVPFWFFHHRMALMDGLLTLWLSLSLWAILMLLKTPVGTDVSLKTISASLRSRWIYLLGLVFGLALLTKLPAILALPALGIWCFWSYSGRMQSVFLRCLQIGVGLGLGVVLFATLKIAPAFPQLFSRGGDFLFSFSEIFLQQGWQHSLTQFPRYLSYLVGNLSLGLMVSACIPLCIGRYKKTAWLLLFSAIIFLAPMWLMGKVIYPRYFFPSAIFFTLLATLGIREAWQVWVRQAHSKTQHILGMLCVTGLVAQMAYTSIAFIGASWWFPNTTPFIKADREQYLTEWSSGHGVVESVALIQLLAVENKVAVATEGHFGTLPDALVMYLHKRNVDFLFIDGIGQPVSSIPQSFWDATIDAQQSVLVVNEHRLDIKLPSEFLLAEYCRPYGAPCLQIWDITTLRPKSF